MRPVPRTLLFAPLLALLLIGCRSETPAVSELPTISLQIGKRQFTLEVAADHATRQQGLMFRKSMPSDHGMIFVFAREEPLSFWMKNTFIPLDILFLDAERRIISIQQMLPHDLRGVRSPRPAKYAIEINAGMAQRAGAKTGDRLDLPEHLVALE
jgi:uncharacterized membrane protein (UPF0127 family)